MREGLLAATDNPSARSTASARAWLILLVAGGLAVTGFLALPSGSTEQTLAFLVIAAAAIGAAGLGVMRERAAERAPWLLIVVGQALFVGGDVLWTWFDLRGEEPFPSIADASYLSGYLFIGAGLLIAIRRRIGGGDRAGLLDAAILTTGAWVIWWEALLGPTAAGLLLTPGAQTVSFRLLLASLGAMLGADLLFGIQSLEGTYVDGGLADVGWLTAYLMFSAAALHPSMVELVEPHPVTVTLLGRIRLAFLAVAMLVGPTLLALGDAGTETIVGIVAGATAVLSVLVLVRLAGLVRVLQQDIARREVLEEQLSFQALHDPLTGLANRRGFMAAVGTALSASTTAGETRPAVLFLDLDDFKDVNDALGHEAGDELLRVVGRRIAGALRPGDVAGRLGGDEFAVLLPHAGQGSAGSQLADDLLDALDDPIRLGTNDVAISASVGLAISDGSGTSAIDDLLRRADVAMYHAKAAGKHRWAAFDTAIHGTGQILPRAVTRSRVRAGSLPGGETGGVPGVVSPIEVQPTSNERLDSPQAKPSIA
jgi:diguanylate cyclase (GGDEF)-like protein